MKAALRRIRRRAGRARTWVLQRLHGGRQTRRAGEIYGTFIDGRGYRFELERGFRDRVKPGWRRMLEPPSESLSGAELASSYASSVGSVQQMLTFLQSCGVTTSPTPAWNSLEIGCYDGRRAFALASTGMSVTALDLTEYYVEQSPDIDDRDAAYAQANARLTRFRRQTREVFEKSGVPSEQLDQVSFVEQDICSPSLPESTYDLIVSWEVLEHIRNPEAAFAAMFRVMRPGAVAFHEYNPFFCFSGGHSLCTLDFPFGHARIGSDDFERLVRQYRPSEAEQDLRFFHQNLNRMTLADLRSICARVGFQPLAILEWPQRDDLLAIGPDTLDQVRELYPTVTPKDLLCRSVWVALRKPISGQSDAPSPV